MHAAPSEEKGSARSHRVLAATLTAIACLAWMLPYWNRFAGVSSAGSAFYVAEQILQGRVPYRDFFHIIPPLNALKTALLIRLFGHNLAAGRFESVLERALFAGLVCWWLSRYFRPAAAFVAVFFAMALFAGDRADALVSYHHDAAILAVAASFCASLFLQHRSRIAWPMAILAGACAGLTFLTAQTVGAAITLCVPAVICVLELRLRRLRAALVFLAAYTLGWLIPTGLLALWLYREHALPQFFQCVFLNLSAKGSAVRVFVRPLWDRKKWVALVTLCLFATGWFIYRKPRPAAAGSRRELAALMAAAAVAIAAAWYAANHRLPLDFVYDSQLPLMAAALTGSILAALYHLWRFWYAGANPDDAQLTLLAATGVATGYSLSLSFAYYGPMVMPGLALVAAIILNGAWRYPKTRLLLAGLCFSVVFLTAAHKYEIPFNWLQWAERASPGVVHHSPYPQLAGLALPEPTGTLVDHITALIQQHAPAGGTLFVYPYFPLFYVLTGMSPPTYGFVHYLDVAPDAVCERDARALIEHPPSVIVRLVQPEELFRFDERYFRGNQPSGGRKIIAAMDQLSPGYRLLETIKLPGSGQDLRILARQ